MLSVTPVTTPVSPKSLLVATAYNTGCHREPDIRSGHDRIPPGAAPSGGPVVAEP
ncbi:hypothetical protein GCM10027079_01510 [Sediminivirga luteola]|uniref:Uncharacterized protein n=1 Tax=Sediminivirga luteola TaxID=1774748 RepID=A0A8J2TXB1_9MICO|nr:hypothetical protein GCM10011333_13130 [Sediminivirga luteola]